MRVGVKHIVALLNAISKDMYIFVPISTLGTQSVGTIIS